MYAEILTPQKIGTDKETLTYEIPETLDLIPGQAVKISLRRKILTGIVWSTHNETEFRTIPIISGGICGSLNRTSPQFSYP